MVRKVDLLRRSRWIRIGLVLLPLAALAGFVFYKASAFHETRNLPYYTVRTLLRLGITYVIALAFGLGVGILAATKERVGNIVIPILDVLQSVPVLGFFPLALAVIIRAFNESTFGLELTSMFLLFTSMEWSIVFGVIAGIKSMPPQLSDMGKVFHVTGRDYIRHIVLPSIYPYVIAGSILAWGSGWYFVILTEFITFGDKVYTLPGLGYYINLASFQYGSVWMALAGLLTIGVVVFTMNRLIWRRLNERARDYRFLALHGFTPRDAQTHRFWARQAKYLKPALGVIPRPHLPSWMIFHFRFRVGKNGNRVVIAIAVLAVLTAVVYGWLWDTLSDVRLGHIALVTVYSLSRLTVAYVISLVSAVGLGFLILRRPATKNAILIAADVLQSIPALAYFPLLWLLFTRALPQRLGLEMAAVLLMLTGMFWYLVFNVIEALEHWPKEITELSGLLDLKGLRYLKHMLVPALFPALVTGSILAWGGGWNATIVSEYVNIGHTVHQIPGLGSALDNASNEGDTHTLIILLVVMSGTVVALNHFLWRRLLSKASSHVLTET